MERRTGSVRTSDCLGRMFSTVCTVPDGHSIRMVDIFVASPSPKCASRGELLQPAPCEMSRNCQTSLPPMIAFTRTLAPMAERLDAVPSHRILIQPLALPLFL